MPRSTITTCLSLFALFSACSPESDSFESGVEPAIVNIAPVSQKEGTFVLTLFLGETVDSSAEVWLYELRATGGFTFDGLTSLSTDVVFPVVLEPGDFVRVPFAYALPASRCGHELDGTIYDSFKDDLTPVTSTAALAPGCNP